MHTAFETKRLFSLLSRLVQDLTVVKKILVSQYIEIASIRQILGNRLREICGST
jgi:hypothetical protein